MHILELDETDLQKKSKYMKIMCRDKEKGKGKGKMDGTSHPITGTRTLSAKTVVYALWCKHRDTDAPPWVRDGVHSHVCSYACQRLCDAAARWWSPPR